MQRSQITAYVLVSCLVHFATISLARVRIQLPSHAYPSLVKRTHTELPGKTTDGTRKATNMWYTKFSTSCPRRAEKKFINIRLIHWWESNVDDTENTNTSCTIATHRYVPFGLAYFSKINSAWVWPQPPPQSKTIHYISKIIKVYKSLTCQKLLNNLRVLKVRCFALCGNEKNKSIQITGT